MGYRFVASLTPTEQEALVDAYQYVDKFVLRQRANGTLFSHQGQIIKRSELFTKRVLITGIRHLQK